mgnify:FL=1
MVTELPEWKAEGKKPPAYIRQEGYRPGDKVPASWLNWFLHRTAESLREIVQAFNDYYTRDEVDALLSVSMPRGVIVMWSGRVDEIPNGWALCDGRTYQAPDGRQVTTPDLRDKFVVGAGLNYQVGDQGGAAQVTLTVEQLPPHSHRGTTNEAGAHTHTYRGSTGRSTSGLGGSAALRYPASNLQTSESGRHSHTFTTETVGGGQPHENRPPYYALAYIMRL